jgi:hypothetical protein
MPQNESTEEDDSKALFKQEGGSSDITIRITPWGSNRLKPYGLTFKTTIDGSSTTKNVNVTERGTSNYIVPPFVIFELQAAGGGGGGSGSSLDDAVDGYNGAGGGGGGFATGVLKLDFDTFDAYYIIIGKKGTGGIGGRLYTSTSSKLDGTDASISYIYGVVFNGTTEIKTGLVECRGGDGGVCANLNE